MRRKRQGVSTPTRVLAWSTAALLPAAALLAVSVSGALGAAVHPKQFAARYDPSQFAPARYAAEADALGPGLAAQLESQLGMTTAEYLADTAAAAAAVTVVDSLREAGVPVAGSRIDGTRLTVYLKTAGDEETIRAAGASPVVGDQPGLAVSTTSRLARAQSGDFTSPIDNGGVLDGGDGYYFTGTDPGGAPGAWVCTVGFLGHDARTRQRQYLTAGHCGSPKANIDTPDGPVTPYAAGAVDDMVLASGAFGSFLKRTFAFGGGGDAGLVAITNRQARTRAAVTTWAGGWSDGGAPVPVIGQSAGIVGAPVCRSGITSGWQCGTIMGVDHDELYATGALDKHGNPVWVHLNTVVTTACALPGDSGGPIMMGEYAVGITSLSDWYDCSAKSRKANSTNIAAGYRDDSVFGPHAVYYTFGFPMVSAIGATSAQSLFGSTWRLDTSRGAAAALRASDPTLVGKAVVASRLTVRTGAWTKGTRFGYQWYANGAPIKGATGPALAITKALRGKRIIVKVTGWKAGYRTVVKIAAARVR
ncbi:S1 family peptidase [Gryllotalpicola sp.]|uniref:S1 family peptidase n=1 Tax=Gryllotalpicola sp. TaxID=1932787 RepID=UPI0026393EF4|nr:S1 family peptidase [Gryllotalpicola sp.]